MAKKSISEPAGADWTVRDEALWATAEIAALSSSGRLHERWPASVPFALRHGETEKPLAHGPFQLLSFTAPGDGSYSYNDSSLIAFGRGAAPLMIGHAVGRAIGNSARRRRAEALAQPRWMQIDAGTLTVSTHGFYMHNPTAIFSWDWQSIDSLTLAGPGSVNLLGRSANGQVNWMLHSDWAELLFFLWASAFAPSHPQLLGRTWLPGDWLTKAFIHAQESPGYPGPADFQQITRAIGAGS